MLLVGNAMLELLLLQGGDVPMATGDLIFQGVVALLFAAFAVTLIRITTAEREKRDTAWQKWMTDQTALLVGSMKEQAVLLTGAIDREREQRRQTLEEAHREFGGNMDRIAGGLVELTKALASHDDNAQDRHERILEAIQHINGAKGA